MVVLKSGKQPTSVPCSLLAGPNVPSFLTKTPRPGQHALAGGKKLLLLRQALGYSTTASSAHSWILAV